MNNNAFLIESLQRTIKELCDANLSVEQQQQLIDMGANKTFRELFDIPDEDSTQLDERGLSELTNYQFDSYHVGMSMLFCVTGGVTLNGEVFFDRAIHPGNMFSPKRPQLLFRLIDKEEAPVWDGVKHVSFRLRNKNTGFINHVNFEVYESSVSSELLRIIKSMLPEHISASVKN